MNPKSYYVNVYETGIGAMTHESREQADATARYLNLAGGRKDRRRLYAIKVIPKSQPVHDAKRCNA